MRHYYNLHIQFLMKHIFSFVINLIFLSNTLHSQSFCIVAQGTRSSPLLSQIKGDINNCAATIYSEAFPDLGFEYVNSSGIVFSTSIGYQRDWFGFSEITKVPTYGGPLAFAKTYKSVPIIFSSGYSKQIRQSAFRVNIKAGAGFGIIHSENESRQYSFDGLVSVYDNQGIHADSQHVLISIEDSPLQKLSWQTRISISLEYKLNRFFVRSFVEARTWLSHFEEIKYHSENSSSYNNYSQIVGGHFSVRTGYLGIGIGVGWYFKNSP